MAAKFSVFANVVHVFSILAFKNPNILKVCSEELISQCKYNAKLDVYFVSVRFTKLYLDFFLIV